MSDEVTDITSGYAESLSEQQIRAIQLIAFGMHPGKVAKSIGVSDVTVRQWMRTDPAFRKALVDFTDNQRHYHQSMLNQAAVRAWDRLFEYLDTDYPEEDRIGRTNQAQAAKFVISELNLGKQEEEKEDSTPQLHITEDSADIIARKVHELQGGNRPVETEYTISDSIPQDDPRLVYNKMDSSDPDLQTEVKAASNEAQYPKHPNTEYGEISYNDDQTKARCHICGEWEIDLVIHIRNEHKLSPARYRHMYKIPNDIRLGLFKPVAANQKEIDEYNKAIEGVTADEATQTEESTAET